MNDEGLDASPREPRQLSSRAIVEYQTGNFSEGATYLQRLLEITQITPPGPTLDRCLLSLSSGQIARISGATEGLEVARQAAETLISYPSANPLLSLFSRAGLAWMAVVLGDSSAAAELYPYLYRYGISILLGYSAPRLLGLLAHTMGDPDKATEHFEESLTYCREAGYRPELAWTCCDYADTLRERDAEGDRAKAITLLEESLAISSELGMRPLMERVLSRREILGA